LGLSHTVLSLALTGKRGFSKKACVKVSEALHLTPEETEFFLANRKSNGTFTATVLPEIIDLDKFAVISDWYHFAILSLLEMPGVRLESRWVSSQLGISPVDAQMAIERLKRLGLIHKEKGKWKQKAKSFKIDDRHSTSATRKFQGQILAKAVESLENDPLPKRDHTSITFAMKPSQVFFARERIKKFRRDLCSELEKHGTGNTVYTLSVQLFPMSKESR